MYFLSSTFSRKIYLVTFREALPISTSQPSHQPQYAIDKQHNSVPVVESTTSSFQITLNNEENGESLSSDSKVPQQILNPTILTKSTSIVGHTTRSAFRPFLKATRLNQQPLPITPRAPLTVNGGPYQLPPPPPPPPLQQQQQQQLIAFSQQYPFFNLNSLIYKQQQRPLPLVLSSSKNIDHSMNMPNLLNISRQFEQTPSLTVSPDLKWYNIMSNSIHDIPRLSTAYSAIPLRIILPVASPTYNQKLLNKHDLALENRLLGAGLSPETVALYERILNIAGNRQLAILSSPKINVP